jgi:16S rRNA (cytosine1402-N4)-methyltransferase
MANSMTDTSPTGHVPVLADEVVDWLVWRDDGVYVDATLGAGGHASLICGKLSNKGRLFGIDRDPLALEMAGKRLEAWSANVTLCHSPFGSIGQVLTDEGITSVSGVFFDLGVSSMQIDMPERGFSFRFGGPLDMRMDPGLDQSAADLVNGLPEDELVSILRKYGEEPNARAIARDLCNARRERLVATCEDLVAIIGNRGRGRPEKTQARVFQALRIAVNRELEELERGLAGAIDHLEPGGRLVVIAYHSLEDRIVKDLFRHESAECLCPPGTPVCICGHVPRLKRLTRRVVKPESTELDRNPRARSARMRVVERLPDDAP